MKGEFRRMKSLQQLISEKENELKRLENSLGLGFPIVEQAKMAQISHLQLELEDLRQIEEPSPFNDNQKIVFKWLKWRAVAYNESVATILYFLSNKYPFLFEDDDGSGHANAKRAYEKLNRRQQFEVLAAFAQWGLEQEEAE